MRYWRYWSSYSVLFRSDSKTIENLKSIVDKHCPVLDILNKGVTVQLDLAENEKERKIA